MGDIIEFVGGSRSSQHCIVTSHLYPHTGGGSHSGVAKWDLGTQGGQVSRVLITGLNADPASASRWGGRNRLALASVHPPPQSVSLDQTASSRGVLGPGPPCPRRQRSADPSFLARGPGPPGPAGLGRGTPGPGPPPPGRAPPAGLPLRAHARGRPVVPWRSA